MPMRVAPRGASAKARKSIVGSNIREFHGGPRYASLRRKYGAKKANKIAVAAGFAASRRGRKRR